MTFQLANLDWLVLIAYLIIIALIGIIAGLRVSNTDHYFLGARGFNKWLMMGQSFGVGTHAEMPVSLAGAVYSHGFSGIWYQWKNLFATPFYWLIAPLFRRFRRTTMGEVTEDRYGSWMAGVYTVFALAYFTINMAGMLKGAGKVIHQAAGGNISVDTIVYGMTIIFIIYSFIGGLVASAWTDFAQGFLIIILSFLLIPLGWPLVSGMDGMRRVLDPHFFSLSAPEGIGPWFILMLTINGLIGIISQPHMLAAVGTGKDEHACRQGMFFGNFVKRFCTVGWAIVGLLVAAIVATPALGFGPLNDPEDAFGFACRQLLFPGGLGLLIACILAANMSTCSAFMVDSGALFTRGFYQRYIRGDASDRHYLWMGRVSGLALTLLGVVYAAYFIDRVLHSFLLTETMATYMGVSLFGGVLWRRANRYGALASLVAAIAVNFAILSAQGKRLDYWDPNIFGISLAAGIAALIVVSLATPAEPKEKLDQFFANLREPAEGTAPAGTPLLVVDLLRPKALRNYAEDWRGFGIGWAYVLALVALTWLWLQS